MIPPTLASRAVDRGSPDASTAALRYSAFMSINHVDHSAASMSIRHPTWRPWIIGSPSSGSTCASTLPHLFSKQQSVDSALSWWQKQSTSPSPIRSRNLWTYASLPWNPYVEPKLTGNKASCPWPSPSRLCHSLPRTIPKLTSSIRTTWKTNSISR